MSSKKSDGKTNATQEIQDLTGISKLVQKTKTSAEADHIPEEHFQESAPSSESEFLMDFEPMESEPSNPSDLADEAALEFETSQESEAPLLEEAAPFEMATPVDLVEFDEPVSTHSEATPDPKLEPTHEHAAPEPQGLEQVKVYSDTLSQVIPPVPASVPFTLRIDGPLKPHEKERLLEIISRENMGIRELDLEPQLEAGRILIPRVSEFAAVLLVQALRSAHVKIRMEPSDRLTNPSSGNTSTSSSGSSGSNITQSEVLTTEPQDPAIHPAERIPVTPSATFAQFKRIQVVDTVTASATLKSNAIDFESTSLFQQMLESLQRELKYKAYRKGATAVIGFSVTVTPQDLPSHYRLLVMGTAVKEFSPL